MFTYAAALFHVPGMSVAYRGYNRGYNKELTKNNELQMSLFNKRKPDGFKVKITFFNFWYSPLPNEG